MSRRIAAVVLVDRQGRLLLQERDDRAPVDPDKWSMVGGGVEEGESDAEAAVRELAEETGLHDVPLTPLATYGYWCDGCTDAHEVAVFTAYTDLTDDDVECHEGRRIVFVDPTTVHTLDWNRGLVTALPRVIGSDAYVDRFGRRPARDFGSVVLVDRAGALLLQERDEHAPLDPERWGLTGGHLEPGEDPAAGAARELEEETGIRVDPAALELFEVLEVFHPHYGSVDRVHVYVGPTDLTDADVDCREGRQIVFVPPERARSLDLTMSAVLAVPALLASDLYRRITA
ncbi:MAG TPA: NUDIX hydrolase [Nocardioides sp.]|nr:NUDIX hydrolase [Nocardioides sp.]